MRILLISANRHDRYLGSLPLRPVPVGLAYLAAGVPFVLSLIFGRPGETRETAERALALAERSGRIR